MTSGGMYGANPDQLDALNKKLTQQSQAVTTLQQDIGSAIQGTTWTGTAREQFLLNWQTNYTKTLTELSQGLTTLGEEVQKRAAGLRQIM